MRVEAAQLLAVYPVEPGPGLFPDLDPPLARGDLRGAPTRERLLLHRAIVATSPGTDPWEAA